jgi:hypothetical protein
MLGFGLLLFLIEHHDAQLFTNDREKLPAALDHDVSSQSVHVPEIKLNQTIASEREVSQTQQQEQSIGLGIVFWILPAPDNGSVARAQTLLRPT